MTKRDIFLRKIIKYRPLLLALVVELTLGLFFVVYSLFRISSADAVVWSRYTFFGPTHYYRDRWYYFYTWPTLGILITLSHTIFAIRAFRRGHRLVAVGVLLAAVFLISVMFIVLRHITALPR